MTRKQVLNYLKSSGFSKEQIQAIVEALEQKPTTKNDLGVDLISKEQTIDRVLTYFNHIDKGNDDEWVNGYEAGEEDAIAVIESMPSVTPQESRWISVNERLPEKNVEVLVTTEWDCITIGEMFSNNDWFIHEGATNAEIDEIKAWMPLPKPYKSQESEEK